MLAPETEHKVQELEAFLFGSDEAFKDFGAEQTELLDRLNTATQARQAEPDELGGEDRLLVWEDRGQRDQPTTAGTILQALEEQDERQAVDPTSSPALHTGGLSAATEGVVDRQPNHRRQAVWHDPDDAAISVEVAGKNRLRKLRQHEEEQVLSGREYEQRLRQLYARMNPRTTWAKLDKAARQRSQDDGNSDTEGEEAAGRLTAGAEPLLGRDRSLSAKVLEVSRVNDANEAEPSSAVVRSVEFHPSGQLLLTAGLDKRLRFFQVDGKDNEKVQSLYLEDLPIHQAAFACDGQQVVAVGRRKFFYIIDLACSKVERIRSIMGCTAKSLEKFVVSPASTHKPIMALLNCQGSVPLISLQTRQAIGHLQTSANVRSAAFAPDGLHLLTSGKEGLVHVWDLRMQRCIQQQQDQGTILGTSLAISPSADMFAAGSDSGVVNLYKGAGLLGRQSAHAGASSLALPAHVRPAEPVKSFLNLRDEVDTLSFSPDGQMLALASRMAKNALRIAHVSSRTVFENWPTANTPLGYVHSLAFSPGGGLLAVGNARGRVLLYRMHHYAQL